MERYDPRPIPPLQSAFTVAVVDEEVVFIGSGAVSFSMTPQAAQETGRRIADALQAGPEGQNPRS